MKTVLFILLCVLLAFSVQAQDSSTEKETTKVSKLTLAKNDADGNIVENVEVFSTKDIPIFCYIDLNTDNPTLVKMDFIAVKAKGLRPNSRIITAKYKTKKGENGVAFDATPKKIWAVGDYKVNIYLDGKLAESKKFKIGTE